MLMYIEPIYIWFYICLSSLESPQLQHYHEILALKENQLQSLRSEFALLSSDLALREELTSELEIQVQGLEKKVCAAEEEAHGAALKLNVALEEKKELSDQVEEKVHKAVKMGFTDVYNCVCVCVCTFSCVRCRRSGRHYLYKCKPLNVSWLMLWRCWKVWRWQKVNVHEMSWSSRKCIC